LTKFERILFTKPPLGLLIRRTKNLHPPGFDGVPLYDVLRFFYIQLRSINFRDRAASVAFNFLMAIPPSLLFLFTLIPHLPFFSKDKIQQELHTLIIDIIPAETYNQDIIAFVDNFFQGDKIALISFGFIFALYFASNAMMGLIRSFYKKGQPGFLRRMGLLSRWTAIKLTMILFGLFLSCLFLMVLQGALLNRVISSPFWRDTISYSRWIFILLLIFYSIAFIFKYGPSLEQRWKLYSPGAIATTILIVLSSILFSNIADSIIRYNLLYGSLGTILMVMVLIYIISISILVGFELNLSISTLKPKPTT
jgi:membrane protein